MKERLIWLDNLRGFAILLVVLGHCLQYFRSDFDTNHLANYIYSSHMPLFVTMSGFVSYRGIKVNEVGTHLCGVIKKRSVQLLLPYVFWSILLCVLLNYSLFKVLITDPIYWFLILLFIIIVIYEFVFSFSIKWNCSIEWVITGTFVLLVIANRCFAVHMFSMELLYFYFLFYIMGVLLKKYYSLFDKKRNCLRVLVLNLVFFIVFGYCYMKNDSPLLFYFIPQSLFFMITGISGSLSFFLIFMLFGNKETKLISKCGRLSLGIYVIQAVLCHSFKEILSIYGCWRDSYLMVGLMFLAISGISLGLSIILKRFKITAYLIGAGNN